MGEFHDPSLDQRAEKLPSAFGVGLLGLGRFVAAGDQLLHRAAAVSFAAEHIEQHPVRDLEAQRQALGLGGDQAQERVLVPVDEVLLRRCWDTFIDPKSGKTIELLLGLNNPPINISNNSSPSTATQPIIVNGSQILWQEYAIISQN